MKKHHARLSALIAILMTFFTANVFQKNHYVYAEAVWESR